MVLMHEVVALDVAKLLTVITMMKLVHVKVMSSQVHKKSNLKINCKITLTL